MIGGTRLVGRQIARAAVEGGHDVTLFNRGRSDPDGVAGAAVLIGDRDADRSALQTGEWDTTIDVCAYAPGQVRSLLETLGHRGGQYVFVSTISVYDHAALTPGFTEAADLLPPVWDETAGMAAYGELKVACEQTANELVGDQLLVIRPGYVIGPYDCTERFTHWVRQVAAGAPFDGPAADQPLQAVDSRDLGAFTVSAAASQLNGAFNVTGPQQPPTFRQAIETIAGALGKPLPEVRWADPDEERDDLPLSSPREWWPLMQADVSRALGAGLSFRPLDDTVRAIATGADEPV